MDLYKTIQILHEERERLAKLIAYLEHQKNSKGASPRPKPPGSSRAQTYERSRAESRLRTHEEVLGSTQDTPCSGAVPGGERLLVEHTSAGASIVLPSIGDWETLRLIGSFV